MTPSVTLHLGLETRPICGTRTGTVDNERPTCEACLAVRWQAWGHSIADIADELGWAEARVVATLRRAR